MEEMYYQWDYVSFWFEMDPELFGQHLHHIEEMGQAHIGGRLWQPNVKVRALGDAGGGKRRYAVSVWGPAARVVQYLPTTYIHYVRRLDVKTWPGDLQDMHVNILATELFTHPNPYNITAINSRPRRKDDKRDAGGRGFAIGSHKSDLRVSVYSRASSKYCVEFQCRGDMLRRILDTAPFKDGVFNPSYNYWAEVKQAIVQVGAARYGRALAAAGMGEYVPVTVEQRLAACEEAIDQLNTAEAQQSQMDLDSTGLPTSDEPPRPEA